MAGFTVTKRKRAGRRDGFVARMTYTDPVTGKQRETSTTFDTKREAEKQNATWRLEMERGTWVNRDNRTVGDLLLSWLDSHQYRVRESTFVSYKHIVTYHLIPGLGSIPAQKLTPAMVSAFYAEKMAAGASPRVVKMCHLHLGQALGAAMRQGIVTRKVTDAVDPPRQTRKVMAIWSAEETKAFLAVAEESIYGPIWLIMAGAALRRGEALGLRWKDIDWERGLIKVRQQVQAAPGGARVVPYTKDGRGGKVVPLDPRLMAALLAHLGNQEEARRRKGEDWQDHDLVFPSGVGTPIIPRNLAREYYTLRDRAGVPKVRIHDIRHTVATHFIETGVDIKAVSEHLGHKDVGVTRSIYQHVTEHMRRGVADAFGSIFLGE